MTVSCERGVRANAESDLMMTVEAGAFGLPKQTQ
jgi:hypothetical protein